MTVNFGLLSLLLVCALGTPTWGSEAEALNCAGLLAPKGFSTFSPRRLMNDFTVIQTSYNRPAYQDADFSLRVISESVLRSQFSASQLKDFSVSEIKSLINTYKSRGLNFTAQLQVLVEAHPRAIDQGEEYSPIPFVSMPYQVISIPNLMGKKKILTSPDQPRFLILTAMSATYHSVQNKFALAHELAHLTENPMSHKDSIWSEARADILAYLITGDTDVVFPEAIEHFVVDAEGAVTVSNSKLIRSMRNPSLKTVNDVIPQTGAHHQNSELISSALFQIARKTSPKRTLEFVQWMDHLEGGDAIQSYLPLPTNFPPRAVKKPLAKHMKSLGDYFRRWVGLSNLSAEEKNAVLQILHDHLI